MQEHERRSHFSSHPWALLPFEKKKNLDFLLNSDCTKPGFDVISFIAGKKDSFPHWGPNGPFEGIAVRRCIGNDPDSPGKLTGGTTALFSEPQDSILKEEMYLKQ